MCSFLDRHMQNVLQNIVARSGGLGYEKDLHMYCTLPTRQKCADILESQFYFLATFCSLRERTAAQQILFHAIDHNVYFDNMSGPLEIRIRTFKERDLRYSDVRHVSEVISAMAKSKESEW